MKRYACVILYWSIVPVSIFRIRFYFSHISHPSPSSIFYSRERRCRANEAMWIRMCARISKLRSWLDPFRGEWEELVVLWWESNIEAHIGQDASRVGLKWSLTFWWCCDDGIIFIWCRLVISVMDPWWRQSLVRWERGASDYIAERIPWEDIGVGMETSALWDDVLHRLFARRCCEVVSRPSID